MLREDVGRHNAVDKVVGWALKENRLPLRGTVLMVSGRAVFELTQKALMAGSRPGGRLGAVVARRRPGDDAGMTLVGFLRGSSMVVYSGGRARRRAVRAQVKEGQCGMTSKPPVDDVTDALEVVRPKTWAAGVPGVMHAMGPAFEGMGAAAPEAADAMNQKDGFDCMSCAWPDPDHRKTLEFCENGARRSPGRRRRSPSRRASGRSTQ